MKKIITSYTNPAIPYRGADWVAFYDGEEERGEYGFGATEAEAIQDLRDMFPEGEE